MKYYIFIIVSCLIGHYALAQTAPDTNLLTKTWKAGWIGVTEEAKHAYGTYLFKKSAKLDQVPARYVVHVSADNRFRLFVNGRLIGEGPSLGDINHWNYETFDIASYLKIGENVLEAVVWNNGSYMAVNQFTVQTAFLLQGNTKKESDFNTDDTWKVREIKGRKPLDTRLIGYYALTPGELIDQRIESFPWIGKQVPENQWKNARFIAFGVPAGVYTAVPSNDWAWGLVQSSIPQMEKEFIRFKEVRKVEGIKFPKSFLCKATDIEVPANSVVTFWLDQTFLTNAYPHLLYSKGKDAEVSIKYAEALYEPNNSVKNNRNIVNGKVFIGKQDSIVCNGLERQMFSPLDWRTFRYIEVKIRTAQQPLVLHDIYSETVGYPFQLKSKLVADDTLIDSLLVVGWRTARLCAVETYFDCPYYEQLQYAGDTRIQCMISYYNADDDRLARKAIDYLDYSRISEGLTQCRYPSSVNLFIPPFSLAWIGMLYDFHLYRDDIDFVRKHLPGVRSVLSYFERYQLPDGSYSNPSQWNFTDWPDGRKRGWKFGTPPIGKDACSSILDLQLLMAYQYATKLEADAGYEALSKIYRQKAELLSGTIQLKYWDVEKEMYADDSQHKSYSQHANILAILCSLVKGNEAYSLYGKLAKPSSDMAETSIYFKYYQMLAMRKAGHADEYLNNLDIWKENLRLGLTTWAENSNVEKARSDCHAWGASPNIELYRSLLGIDSAAPGFRSVRIEPHLGHLTKVEGEIPYKGNFIKVSYQLNGKKWKVCIHLPERLNGIFVFQGEEKALISGRNEFIVENLQK